MQMTITKNEQIIICKILAKVSMWGHGWVGSTVTEELDKQLTCNLSWEDLYEKNKVGGEDEATGTITDEKELENYLHLRYQLCNYEPGRLDLFYPQPYGGLFKVIVGELAERYGKLYDPHNYEVYQYRAREAAEQKKNA